MTDYRLLPAGDIALSVEFGSGIERDVNTRVLELARRVAVAEIVGITECVPTFRSLMIYYDPLLLPYTTLVAHIGKLTQDLQALDTAGRSWRLPMCYDESLAFDLAEVATRAGLAPAQVIERHSAVTYQVYMLGFLPGQPYLGGVASELALPRRSSPRMRIPAGSVAIANAMCCIFPTQTPCGWHVIGRCPIPLWDFDRGATAPLLQPGDRVGFVPVSLREYEGLQARAADGEGIAVSSNNIGDAAA